MSVTTRSLVVLSVLAAACSDGDTGSLPPDADRCTALPAVEPRGEPSPSSLGVDPQETDGAVETTFAPEAVVIDDVAFPLGPAAGALRGGAASLAGTAQPGASVTLRVWRDGAAAGSVRLVEERPVTADGAGRLAVTVDGLAADTVYRYGWFAGAAPTFTGRSGLGRFRTPPPAGGKVTLRIAATTCTGSASAATRAELAPFAALSELAAAEPDLALHLGDASYNDGALTLDDYRAEWRRTLGEAGYRDLLASAGIYVTWDDHEIDDNYDPEAIDPARLAAGRQAFFEALPVERGDGDRLWTSYQWGDTVEVIVMDLRSERLPSTQGDGGGQFVSEAQLAFVEDRLANSSATFKLVLSSVNIANLSTPWDTPLAFDDRWEGWADQRTRLLDFIVDQDVRNVFFLAGDIHVGFVGRVEPEGHRHGALWELTVGPGASEANPLGLFYEFSDEAQRNDVFPCDQFVFAHGRQQVSTVLTLDPGAETLRAEYRDVATDELLFDGVLQHER